MNTFEISKMKRLHAEKSAAANHVHGGAHDLLITKILIKSRVAIILTKKTQKAVDTQGVDGATAFRTFEINQWRFW